MPEPSTDSAPLLVMRGIVKQFPGVRALDGIDLEALPGEVHCLLGQNGAGKSTGVVDDRSQRRVRLPAARRGTRRRSRSEVPEVLGLADRVLVLREGRVIREAGAGELDEHAVLDMIMEGSAL